MAKVLYITCNPKSYVEGHEFDRERADDIIRKGISDAEKRATTF